jgi:hypothetical protein
MESLFPYKGSIISNSWILTAAHCTNAVPKDEPLYVNIGDHDISSTADADSKLVRVVQVIQNSNYDSVSQDSDTSLLRLSTPLVFSRNVNDGLIFGFYILISGVNHESINNMKQHYSGSTGLPAMEIPQRGFWWYNSYGFRVGNDFIWWDSSRYPPGS